MLRGMWTSLKSRAFVFCCGLALMLVGPFYSPENTRVALFQMEEMLRKMYWGDSC